MIPKETGLYRVKEQLISYKMFFLVLLIVVFYLIFPPRGNFGDAGFALVMFDAHVINYIENDYDVPFYNYLEDQFKNFHKDKLASGDGGHYKIFDLQGMLNSQNMTTWMAFVLNPLAQLSIHYLSFKQLDVETGVIIYSFIIFIATFIYAYKFGNEIIDKKFGIILAVVILTNIYFAQIYRTFMLPQLATFPLLFLMSFYYLISLHNIKNKRKKGAAIGLTVALALAWLNGYPNTSAVLLGLLAAFFIILRVHISLTYGRYRFVPEINYLYIFFGSVSLILLVSGFWSLLLGYELLHAFESSLRGRFWGDIFFESLYGHSMHTLATGIDFSYVWQKCISIVRALYTQTNFVYGAHEASFLLHLNFLNILEKLLLVAGVLAWLRNIFSKKLLNFFLSFIFVFFWVRAISHGSVSPIGRTEFDFFFVVLFFVSYGFYVFVGYATKNVPEFARNITFESDFFSSKNILCSVLLIEVVVNGFIFNYFYLYKYNEGQGFSNGVYQLRKLYKGEINNEQKSLGRNYLVLDVGQGASYKYDIETISLLRGDITHFSIEKFAEYFKNPEGFREHLRKNKNDNFYFILPHNLEPVAATAYRSDIRATYRRLYKYISIYDRYKVIDDRQGFPLFSVVKLSDSNTYSFVGLDKNNQTYSIDLNEDEKLKFVDFPSGVKKISLESGGHVLNLDFSKIYFNRYHFSFNDKSVVEFFNNFDTEDNILNITQKDAKVVHEKNHYFSGIRMDILQPSKKPVSNVDFQYDIGVPVKSILAYVPFLFFNDKDLVNAFRIYLKTDKDDSWEKIYQKRSNGSLLISDHKDPNLYDVFQKSIDHAPLNNIHTNHFYGIIDAKMSPQVSLRYQMKAAKHFVRPYSLTYHEESSPNHMIFNVDTSQYSDFLERADKNIKLTVEFREKLKYKVSGFQDDYVLGFGTTNDS